MCTSIVVNKKSTFAAFNLDILDMEWKVVAEPDKVYIAINDATEGWMPLFGANLDGNFVGMPTCWPFDARSNSTSSDDVNIINLDIDLLLAKKTFAETKKTVETKRICSIPGLTFQSQLSDKYGNVLQVVPGQGHHYIEKPEISVMTNFSPFKGDSEKHPWMGFDRYNAVVSLLENAPDDFSVSDCFEVLKAAAQNVCPTVVSIVFDVAASTVYWCENQDWKNVHSHTFA